jgi:hypothetical protein
VTRHVISQYYASNRNGVSLQEYEAKQIQLGIFEGCFIQHADFVKQYTTNRF